MTTTRRLVDADAVAALVRCKIESLEDKIGRIDARFKTDAERVVILQCSAAIGALKTVLTGLDKFVPTAADLAAGGEFPIAADAEPGAVTVL